jgi:hypothetical protein
LSKIRDYLRLSRWSLHFSSRDIFNIVFDKLILGPLRALTIISPPHHANEGGITDSQMKVAIFKRGKEKVMKELDCVSLLNRMKSLE